MDSRTHPLHVITTGKQSLEEVEAIVRQFPSGQVDVLHIREKQRSARELTRWYRTLKPMLPDTFVVINDRLDAALAVQADGVQLGAGSLTLPDAKALLPRSVSIGCSIHSPEEAVQAAAEGADYCIFGHVYETGSKAGLPPRGLSELSRTAQACPIPVIAIGGITPERVDEVLQTGAKGVAVLSSVFLHPSPAEQIAAFRRALDHKTYS